MQVPQERVERKPRLEPRFREVRNLAIRARTRAHAAFDYVIYERGLGVDTRGIAVLAGHDQACLPYMAAKWRLLHDCLDRRRLGEDDVFLDAGCGKGRIVIQAARLHRFRRVIGFDISPELIDIAHANLARCARRLRCADVELHVADASAWRVSDDVTIVFMYNPFTGVAFDRFIDSVAASYDRRPREISLLYVEGPGCEFAALDSHGRFRLVDERKRSVGSPTTRIYEAVPTSGGPRTPAALGRA